MRQNAKHWLGIVSVALLSSGVTLGAYSYMMKKERAFNSEGYSMPVSLASMNAAPAVPTDFTVAAENSVHAVVHDEEHRLARPPQLPRDLLAGHGP